MRFTEQQQNAIDLHGDSLIVSAAAGSGKTAVLTERVVQKLCDGVPAESLMILTFTTAAAEEMRTRISKKLKKRLEGDPTNALLRRQLSMLPSAQISTIHAACFAILRDNFERLGLDPQFSIADESELALMKAEMLDDFVDDLYERADTDPDAAAVIKAFFVGKDDKKLSDAIDKTTEFLDGLPYPDEFIAAVRDADILEEAMRLLEKKLADICACYEREASRGYEGISEFLDSERESIARVQKAVRERDIDGAHTLAASHKFARFTRPKKFPVSLWPTVQGVRNMLKDSFNRQKEMFLYAPRSVLECDAQLERGVMGSFLKVCGDLNGILQKKRLEDRVLSYNDLERYTLKLLIAKRERGSIVKTPEAVLLSEKYDEIIVDEYQDCNLVQELIFEALSRDGKNIFTVGDVKQSIYRFRGAAPHLFLARQKRSEYYDGGGELKSPTKIDLSQNFRSHRCVLEFINGIFYNLMTPTRDIDYRDGHELVPSERYGGSMRAAVDMTLYVTSDTGKKSQTRMEAEAQAVARRIKAMIANDIIYDVETESERAVRASDIAIIMRAPRTCGALFEAALENEGIGCINNNPSEKYLDTPEVRNTLAILQAIDNPYDDVPLISAMYSEHFGFCADELGSIRAKNKRALFYDAVKEYAKTDKKTAEFVKTLTELRTVSLNSSVYGVINAVYEKTGILTRLASHPSGEKKRANLMLLTDLALGFESGRYRGLFAFVTYLKKLAEKDRDMPGSRLRASDDCVSLLSIHKSKGLEFPVVFFVNTAPTIRPVEAHDVMCSQKGVGCKVSDRGSHREFSGPARNVIVENERTDGINEYMRLLYVALTRAGSRLYITGVMKASDAVDMIRCCDNVCGAVTNLDLEEDASFFKWMLMSGIDSSGANDLRVFAGLDTVMKDGGFTSHVISIDDGESQAVCEDKAVKSHMYDAERAYELITRRPQGVYSVPAKLSVSEIKGMRQQEDDFYTLPASPSQFKKPRFLQGGVTGADRGSATHKFLQFCDFERIHDAASFEKERDRLVEYEFITDGEAALVDGGGVVKFLSTDIMKTLIADFDMYKEERFMFTLPANEVMDTDCTDSIIIQGVLDCLFVKDGRAVIVDYKTDRIKTADELSERYRVQLDMYEKAVYTERGYITDKKYIYSFALGEFIQL